ncbi:MAG: hypothetical protein FK733_08295 [Asgard group archaeon]|nr:hypothetical protein [Asgard group archaeon]
MSPKKRKINCKFCQQKADFIHAYNDFFCSKCFRFQNESLTKEIKLLPILKLKKYNFVAQKYSYTISNDLGSRLGLFERRDLSKFISKKDYNIRYVLYNDINRIVGSVDGRSLNDLKGANASWKVYDYGRNLRGEIQYFPETEKWHIVNANGELIAVRNPMDSSADIQTARSFIITHPEGYDVHYFRITRKGGGFRLEILNESFDPHFAISIVIPIHRKFYL